MLSTRAEFGSDAGSLEAVRAAVGVARPLSLPQLRDAYAQEVVLAEDIVTSDGVALGGQHSLTVSRDGSYRYQGHFRATGWPSYDVAIVTTLSFQLPVPGEPSAPMALTLAAQGSVHGSDESGDRSYSWDQQGPPNPLLASSWGAVRQGQLHHQLTYDADYFGAAGDVASFLGQVVIFGSAFGAVGAGLVVAGEALDKLNLEQLALPGLVGIIAAAGAVYVLGPGMLLPAFIGGAAATAALVKQRHLEQFEIDFVDRVFKGKVHYDQVVLTNLLGVGNRPWTMPLTGGPILVHLGDGYADPTNYNGKGSGPGGQAPGQLLVHELTHAWQIANESFTPEYYCRSYSTAIGTVRALGGDSSAYKYGPPGGDWNSFGPEQQASIVDDWFAGKDLPNAAQSAWPPRDESDQSTGGNPYYRYIRDNIRTGISS